MYNDDEWVRAVVEEIELMQEMEELTENEMENEKTKDQVVNDLKEKLKRFKTIAEKKSSVVKSLKDVKERLVYDINMRKEVETKKEEKIDELEKLIEDGKKIVLSTIREARKKRKERTN
jgi:D-tyrosyl-tRNA(Tyr) deacylase